MNVIVAVVLLLGTTHCRVYYDDLPSWPKFDKEVVKRINILRKLYFWNIFYILYYFLTHIMQYKYNLLFVLLYNHLYIYTSDLTDDLCHVNGALVAEQTNCRQCTQNVSSVMAANDGVHAYIGTK